MDKSGRVRLLVIALQAVWQTLLRNISTPPNLPCKMPSEPHLRLPGVEELQAAHVDSHYMQGQTDAQILSLIWTYFMVSHSDLPRTHNQHTHLHRHWHMHTQFGALSGGPSNAPTQKADWVRKGHSLAQMAFWTRLGVFEEPGHPPAPPTQPHPLHYPPYRIPVCVSDVISYPLLPICLL